MGSPTLKKKTELNYRRGSTAHDCAECNAYVRKFDVRISAGFIKERRSFEPRCMIMGLKPGRAYRINPKDICDAHEKSEVLKG